MMRSDAADAPLDPVLDFLRLLWDVEHRLQSASKRMRTELGITGPQRLVLRIVTRSPGMSAGELARIVRLHPSTITGIVQRLVDRGLLVREADPTDSRRVRLRVRQQARPLTRAVEGTVESAVQRALSRLPSSRVAGARQVLAAISAALERSAAAPRRGRPARRSR
jgi:MarR family transcriptional regulator, organic hydroperoxide resistance regulator